MTVAFEYKFEGPRAMMELGTAPRARATLGALQSVYGRESSNFSLLLQELDELWEVRAWEIVPEGAPYGSPDAMLVDVIGCDLAELERHYNVSLERYRVERVKPARSHGREGASTAAEHVASDDTYPCDHKVTYGTADDHIARLKRDAETDAKAAELLESIRAGETKPHAAAVAMGWRKNTPRVAMPNEPDRAASRLVERFGREWCRDLVIALDAAVQRDA